jgi:hypothetical protein
MTHIMCDGGLSSEMFLPLLRAFPWREAGSKIFIVVAVRIGRSIESIPAVFELENLLL